MRPSSLWLCCTWPSVTAFLLTTTTRPRSIFYASTEQQPPQSQQQEEEEIPLSDVDARVLQAMLSDRKIDLETEEDMRRLLERGTVKTVLKEDEKEIDSEYRSQALQTLADTKLWRKMSAQASDLLESVGIWIGNKIENDVKVLAALGLFAWDRAVRDVARALPAEATKRGVLLLTNSSSYAEASPRRSILEEMNRPEDEIRSVTRSLLDILSGEGRTDAGRGLRTAAPAGIQKGRERVRRAYYQSRKLQRQASDVTRVPAAMLDTAYELRRELAAETSIPGYKTATIRQALREGVVETGNLLREVQQQARLAAQKRRAQRLLAAQQVARANRQVFFDDLQAERHAVGDRVRRCINEPENTWLSANVMARVDDIRLDPEALRQVVMTMILVRDDIAALPTNVTQLDELVEQLRDIRKGLEQIRAAAAESVSVVVGEALWQELLGEVEPPLILSMEDVMARGFDVAEEVKEEIAEEAEDEVKAAEAWFAAEVEETKKEQDRIITAEVVDVVPEIIVQTEQDMDRTVAFVESDAEALGAGLIAELVSDDDFDVAVGETRAAATGAADDDEEEEEPNLAVQLTLRSLDVAFFALEKTFTVAIPNTLLIGETVTQRLAEVNQSGKGKTGWAPVRRAANAKGRY